METASYYLSNKSETNHENAILQTKPLTHSNQLHIFSCMAEKIFLQDSSDIQRMFSNVELVCLQLQMLLQKI